MKRVIVGTAGHIDHGKTRLLEALTGIDCDRWAEEKARGITIDLGFAHLEDRGADREDLQIGFVDVPGHERFLHNALAGLGGIRIMLLAVAADEGVKPQTVEHLQICSLLEIPHGIVALTKRDLVDADLLELAELEVAELVEETPFAGSPILPVSSTTGEGVGELRQALIDLARKIDIPSRGREPFRLPIDRAFQLRGLGAIVTGTLLAGKVEPGDNLSVLPRGQSARVRSLQVHGQERQQATAGERTAIQLTGIDLGALERGEQLAAPEAFAPSRSLAARFTLLDDATEAIKTFVPVRFHLYSSEVVGKLRPLGGEPIEPGASGVVEIRLSQPVTAVRGDRFIIRRPSPAATLGGGGILDPRWRRRRGKALRQALDALENRRQALELWVLENGERGAAAADLAPRLGCEPGELGHELEELTAAGRLVAVDPAAGGGGRGRRWIAPAAVRRVIERSRKVLGEYFRGDRLAQGMPKAQLLGQVLPRRAADLAGVYLGWLEAEKVLVTAGNLVNLPGREAKLSGEESKLSRRLLAAIEAAGLTPPSPKELAAELGAKPQILEGVQRFLVEQGKLVRLPGGLLVGAAAIGRLGDELRASGWDRFTVPEFKDRYGMSRKWAIPLLEHLDSTGVTRRLGDQRQVVRR
jgi:selenocysteine-specific elongation factor